MPVELLEDLLEEPSAAETTAPPKRYSPKPDLPTLGRAAQGGKTSWITAVFMVAFHVGAIAALFFFSWKALVAAAILYVLAINMGIGMGYHRLLTHRGYKTPKWVEYFLAVCGTMSLEGGPIFWVGTHRVHHQLSDKTGDPHTPTEGGWWAHLGWILSGESLHAQTVMLARYAPDLTKDRFHVWLSKYHWVPLTISGFALLAMGGWTWVLWGVFFRVTLGLHATWLVNSATHMWGSRRFATRDESRNNWWVALLTGGEGWHNNHHAHPVSARHGLKWYEFDPNYYGIWLLKKFGLARDIKVAQYDPHNPRPAGAA
ncbi:acyl-CoA desaturase [Alloacidobacterium sp.]|uniref:acyl-CoA desaturase n=1 Tax=Alloacidobacterium sp. TaxID=2951999 RepID=UPI002D5B06AE|nr:fatty acid desaturase [Alloacidobacterium sp.]HYK34653.1 fatty acid desaturase [Alloacidobacterium sp.]